MATTPSRNSLKVTINPDNSTILEIGGWPINISNEALEKEPERISVERDGLSYSLIFTSDGPQVEIWQVNELGEISGLKSVTKLPV